MTLVTPSREHLQSYVQALERGWSHDTLRPEERRNEELAAIEQSPDAFLALMDDPDAKGPPVRLPDGTFVERLPSIRRWLWDDEFCGSILLRWQDGTPELPPTCPGHIGYSVVPWKRGRGYATSALAQMLPAARAIGLPYVFLVTEIGNVASQRVILANGGVLVERFQRPPGHGCEEAFRFRIAL